MRDKIWVFQKMGMCKHFVYFLVQKYTKEKRTISDATALVDQRNKESLQQPSRPNEDLHFR